MFGQLVVEQRSRLVANAMNVKSAVVGGESRREVRI